MGTAKHCKPKGAGAWVRAASDRQPPPLDSVQQAFIPWEQESTPPTNPRIHILSQG